VTLSVRAASPQDYDAILAVARTLGQWFTPRGLTQLAVDLQFQTARVAESGRDVRGFVAAYVSEATGHIGWLGVRATDHRCGIGRLLVEDLAAHLAGRGVAELRVDTLGDSVPSVAYAKTRAFYRAIGFSDFMTVKQDDPEWPERLTLRRAI
jgi:ribosomal protein S18 acetylase RimI-like enzyme